MTFRIGFRFEPKVERMGGRAPGGTLYSTKRGAWRVVSSRGVISNKHCVPVIYGEGVLYVLSTEPAHPGAFKSPKAVLDNYFNQPRSK